MENILNYSLPELKQKIAAMGEPGYRAKQVADWIYRKRMFSFGGMKNLPAALKEKMEKAFSILPFECAEHLVSPKDGAEKFLWELKDGNFIETVFIRSEKRMTLCLSSQVGCKFKCPYCLSGAIKFRRNLTPGEIVAQVLMAEDITGARMTNVVFMGIGEPFDNYDNVEKALKALVSPEGVGIGARKITVSTCGIVPGIKRFSRLGLQVNLSVSIHSADNAVRDELVPANRKYPIDELKAALKEYLENAGRKMTLEYTVIKGKNDSANDAKLLSALARDLAAKINLIECNTTIGQYSSPGAAKTEEFRAALERRGAHVTIRRSKGEDIGAACGQLAGARYVASK